MKAKTEALIRLLAWRPLRLLAVAYWHLTGRKVRARNRLSAALSAAPFAYYILLRQRRELDAADSALRGLVESWPDRPMFSIMAVAPAGADPTWLNQAIASVAGQAYDRWEILAVVAGTVPSEESADPRIRYLETAIDDPIDSLSLAIASARGDFVIPLGEATILAEAALLRFAQAVRDAADAQIFYGDEDRVDAAGRRSRPWFKPRWNAEMALALDYVAPACALKTGEARHALSGSIYRVSQTVHGLVLAMTQDEAVPVIHIPHVLMSRALAASDPDQSARVRAVAARVVPSGGHAEAGPFGTVVVRWPMPDPPPAVTILVPTRDKVDLVRTCVETLLASTRYPNFAVVIIDNGSVEPATIRFFEQVSQDPRVTVLPCDMPYNFAAINNAAVDRTRGAYLCFLNNDTEIIDGDWLGELMRYAVRPGIGAVGAQLLYEDRSIQHAGLVIGLGGAAGHAHRGLPAGESGYFAQAHVAHFTSAVTAACMVVERAKFLAVGGFDADNLAIAYNDVDFCLKLGRAGWRNVYAPQSRLLHLETKSRGADLSPAHVDRYRRELAVLQERWGTVTYVDPLHHPALDRSSETYQLAL